MCALMAMSTYEWWSLVVQIGVAIGVFLTLYVYYRILEATKDVGRTQGTLTVVQMIQAEDVRSARDHLYTNAQPFMYSAWTEEDKDKASLVCAVFDLAAILVAAGAIDAETLLVNWGPVITRCHAICLPFIHERQKENPGFYSRFDRLGANVAKANRWKGEVEYERHRDKLASL